ncbi:hypothetical protein T10_9272 [Trichinella papuae]|uniref:Uncharacterized protein n=1 Tax=Trichinella papuae TaxID=268474 RepID=A0A0V1MWQ3_9BILA|nr:hypothetical protein T10_9272 [Trichinella papuae]
MHTEICISLSICYVASFTVTCQFGHQDGNVQIGKCAKKQKKTKLPSVVHDSTMISLKLKVLRLHMKINNYRYKNCQLCSLNGKMNKQVEVDLKSLNRKIVHNTNFSYRVMIVNFDNFHSVVLS